ncbi:MAG: arylamine N-acetyltransferase family protein [Planctomycetota bacterium]|jgi:arylamine N-acetyltransferase
MAAPERLPPPEIIERVLEKLGIHERPSVDLAGLNAVYAAWCGNIPFDNLQKRIWFAGERTTPVTGGDPTAFFVNWLAHGTGGTCWPTSGGMYALLKSLGFPARRIAGAMINTGDRNPQDAGHGSVTVALDGVDHLVDASILAFEALPLVPGQRTRSGPGIHAIEAVPTDQGFDVRWRVGLDREASVTFRTQPQFDPVDHRFFLDGYERSRTSSPFNRTVYICRRSAGSIVSLARRRLITVAADDTATVNEIAEAQRKEVLVGVFGISREIAATLPPDDPDPRNDPPSVAHS